MQAQILAEQIEVKNPVTGQPIATLPVHSREMVEEAVTRARQAQVTWGATPVKERVQIFKRFADLLMQRQDQLVKVIRQETGKVYTHAAMEVAVIVNMTDYYTRHAARWLKPEKRPGLFPMLYASKAYHHPYGVVGAISPWNFPFILSMVDIIPAMLAGNTIVLKPSEITPFTAIEGRKLLIEAGLPEEVLQIVTGYGATGAALIDFVDFVMFTGSTATGHKVAIRAAERLIPCSLELGGNDPMIILKDADLDAAAAALMRGGFENAGQACVSVERVMVEEAVYADFLTAVKKWHQKFKVGVGTGFEMHMGSLTNARELERTEKHIQDALQKGGTLVAGGKRLPELGPLFHEPTIIADAKPEMEMMIEETFGPLVGIIKVKDVEEAIRIANDTQYGLSATVFSRDVKKAEQVAIRLHCGDVNINTVNSSFGSAALEVGGVKESGLGRRNGRQGLLKYTRTQSIAIEKIKLPAELSIYTPLLRMIFPTYRRLAKLFPFIAG